MYFLLKKDWFLLLCQFLGVYRCISSCSFSYWHWPSWTFVAALELPTRPGIFNKLSMNFWGGTSDQKLRRGPQPSKVSGINGTQEEPCVKEWIKGVLQHVSKWLVGHIFELSYATNCRKQTVAWLLKLKEKKDESFLVTRLPTLFETCDPSLNCTHMPGENFIILHTYLGKALTLTLQEVIQAAGGFGAWTPLQNWDHDESVWGYWTWNAC